MIAYIDEHKAQQRDPERRSNRAKQDEQLMPEITRVWEENFQVYGARKVWLQLNRAQTKVARCTVERLMKMLGIEGIRRGKKKFTTVTDDALALPKDAVNRDFTVLRPNALWVADLSAP